MTALDRLRRNRRVEFVDDERRDGNGLIVTLKRGWTFSALEDNRVRGADTIREITDDIRRATVYPGPFED